MRLAAALLLVALLPGCAMLERPPSIHVVNEGPTDVAGLLETYLDPGLANDTSRQTGRWPFTVAAGSAADLGRLPREPQEYYYGVVTLGNGLEGAGVILNRPHACDLTIRIHADRIEFEPQCVV